MALIVKAWANGAFFVGEPYTLEGNPLGSIEALARYVEYNGHVLLYLWEPGKVEQRTAPKLLNVIHVESWDEVGFADVIARFPTHRPKARRTSRRKRRASARENTGAGEG